MLLRARRTRGGRPRRRPRWQQASRPGPPTRRAAIDTFSGFSAFTGGGGRCVRTLPSLWHECTVSLCTRQHPAPKEKCSSMALICLESFKKKKTLDGTSLSLPSLFNRLGLTYSHVLERIGAMSSGHAERVIIVTCTSRACRHRGPRSP